MPLAIDFHVHLPTTEFMRVTLGPYAQAAERYFGTEVKLRDIEQIAADYMELDMIGVLLAWDAETATGLPPLGNEYIADIVERYPQQFIGFASVDPHKGKGAIREIERAIKELGLAGAKFHPGVQVFCVQLRIEFLFPFGLFCCIGIGKPHQLLCMHAIERKKKH